MVCLIVVFSLMTDCFEHLAHYNQSVCDVPIETCHAITITSITLPSHTFYTFQHAIGLSHLSFPTSQTSLTPHPTVRQDRVTSKNPTVENQHQNLPCMEYMVCVQVRKP